MSFLTPYMLWGTLAASIPIILHFFYRSRYRKLPWAAMKFLLTSIEQTSRRLRFQELLLLLARITLLVLLALALARPSTSAGKGSGRGDAVDAVFVIDTSMSMDARDGPLSRLEQVKKAALAVLDQLPAHSTVQIIAGSDRAALLGPRAPSNLDQAKEIINELKITHQATDFLPAVREAIRAVARGQSPNREFYLFSDMQKRGWEQQQAGIVELLKAMHNGGLDPAAGPPSLGEGIPTKFPPTTVYLVRAGKREPKNVSIVDIVPQDGVPHTGDRAGFAVLVRNSGKEPVRNLQLTVTVDGAKHKETRPIDEIAGSTTRPVPVTVKLDKVGLRILTATVQADELEADNRFDRIIQVRDQVRVLVIDGSPDDRDPEKSASFFLMHALAPVREGERSRFHIQPRMVPAGHAAASLLANQDVVILANVSLQPGGPRRAEALPGDFIRQLPGWVRQGHGLVIFSGDHVNPKAYNETLLKRELLPLPLTELTELPADKPVNFDRATFSSPFFGKFRTDEIYAGFNKVEVFKMVGMQETPLADPKPSAGLAEPTLLKYSNGKPAIVSRKVGNGEVMFVSTAMHPVWTNTGQIGWTDLPLRHGLVIPLLDVMLSHLLHGQTQNHNTRVGELLRWQPLEADVGRAFALLAPDGRRTRLGQPSMEKGRPMVTTTDTPLAGIYRLVPADESADKPGAGVPFAVAADLRESEYLESLTNTDLDKLLGFPVIHLAAGDDPAVFSGAERLKREWTMWLLAAVLAVAFIETALAWLCGRAW